MSQVVEPITGQRMRVAMIAAVGVAAVLLVQDLISNLVFVLAGYSSRPGQDYLAYLLQGAVFGSLIALAFAVGVWVSLWLFAPVSSDQTPGVVILRATLAAASGAVLVFVVQLLIGLIGPFAGVGSLFGNSFPALPWGSIASSASSAFVQATTAFLHQAPVVLLVVLLVWMWLAKHPSRHAESTDSVEV